MHYCTSWNIDRQSLFNFQCKSETAVAIKTIVYCSTCTYHVAQEQVTCKINPTYCISSLKNFTHIGLMCLCTYSKYTTHSSRQEAVDYPAAFSRVGLKQFSAAWNQFRFFCRTPTSSWCSGTHCNPISIPTIEKLATMRGAITPMVRGAVL